MQLYDTQLLLIFLYYLLVFLFFKTHIFLQINGENLVLNSGIHTLCLARKFTFEYKAVSRTSNRKSKERFGEFITSIYLYGKQFCAARQSTTLPFTLEFRRTHIPAHIHPSRDSGIYEAGKYSLGYSPTYVIKCKEMQVPHEVAMREGCRFHR